MCDNTFAIAINPQYDGYQSGLTSMTDTNFFIKKSKDTTTHRETRTVPENRQVASELCRAITRKIKIHKIYCLFRDKICGDDVADMQVKVNTIRKLDSYESYELYVVM